MAGVVAGVVAIGAPTSAGLLAVGHRAAHAGQAPVSVVEADAAGDGAAAFVARVLGVAGTVEVAEGLVRQTGLAGVPGGEGGGAWASLSRRPAQQNASRTGSQFNRKLQHTR